MKKLFTALLFLFAVCFWIQPALADYSVEKLGLETDAQIYLSPIYLQDGNVYALTNNNLYLSKDDGVSWKKINTLPVRYLQFASDNLLYCLMEETNGSLAIYYFLTDQEQWQKKCDTPSANISVFAVLPNIYGGDVVLAAEPSGYSSHWRMHRATDDGAIWRDVAYSNGGYLFEPTPNGNVIFTKEPNSYRGSVSTDNGINWRQFSSSYNPEKFFVSPDYANDSSVFAIFNPQDIYYSTSQGDNWHLASTGITSNTALIDLFFSLEFTSDKTMYTIDRNGKVYVSQNSGFRWNSAGNIELPAGLTLNNFVVLLNDQILLGTSDGVYRTKSQSATRPSAGATTTTANTKFKVGSLTYTVEGVVWQMDSAPYQDQDRVYVPIRYLAYGLGLTDDGISWDSKSQEVTLTKDGTVVKLSVGSELLLINDEMARMDVLPQINNSRVMLPARWVAEAFGATVSWSEETQTVTITYTK